ncbi:oxidoreductase domain-containing protein, partial [Rhodopirellula maiorica SM1]
MKKPTTTPAFRKPSPAASANRRRFLKTTSAGILAAGVFSELPAAESTSANSKLKLLCVGTANRAAADIDGVKSQDIVGLCDVDKNYLDRAAS